MSTDQYRSTPTFAEDPGHEAPPFFGGSVAVFWPAPYGPGGGEGYTLAEARDAITRAFRMARAIAAHPGPSGRARAAIVWEQSARTDLLLFSLGSVLHGLSVHIGELQHRPPGFAIPMDDLSLAPHVVELAGKARLGKGLAYARDLTQAAGPGDQGPRRLALYLAERGAELLAEYGGATIMPATMIADVMLAAVPHAFAGAGPATEGDAADHAESPPGDGAVFPTFGQGPEGGAAHDAGTR